MEQNMAPREVKEACHRQSSSFSMFRGTRRAVDAQMAYSSNQHQFCEDLSQKNKEQRTIKTFGKDKIRFQKEKEERKRWRESRNSARTITKPPPK
jgi:hypothetical protein